jgi:CRISPR type III-B/RAMP module-associated protein Cmr5
MMMKSKSQQYADKVFPNVQSVAALQQNGGEGDAQAKKEGDAQAKKEGDAQAKKYKSLCKKAGALIRISGLMQAVAFFVSKSKSKNEAEKYQHLEFLHHLQNELTSLAVVDSKSVHGSEWLLDYVRNQNLPKYMVMTREILQLCNWHKRLADTLIAGTSDDHDDKED